MLLIFVVKSREILQFERNGEREMERKGDVDSLGIRKRKKKDNTCCL
jgi:hypothetical protein